jgi:hypothetical protein
MRKLIITLALVAALPMSTPAFADNLSDGPIASVGVVGSYAFLSVAMVGSFVGESAEAVSKSGGQLSDALRGRTRWHVATLVPEGEQTRVTLREVGGNGRLEVMMQTARVTQVGLRPHDALALTPMGKTGHALRRGDTLVALVTDKGRAMGQSAARP